MPKASSDPTLKAAVEQWITRRSVSQRQAAAEIGINASVLSRFLGSGCALSKTRAAMQEALVRDAGSVTTRENRNDETPQSASPTMPSVAFLRNVLHVLLTALDALEQSARSGDSTEHSAVHPRQDTA
jgi:predicted XRE-type DNA-binding protein